MFYKSTSFYEGTRDTSLKKLSSWICHVISDKDMLTMHKLDSLYLYICIYTHRSACVPNDFCIQRLLVSVIMLPVLKSAI